MLLSNWFCWKSIEGYYYTKITLKLLVWLRWWKWVLLEWWRIIEILKSLICIEIIAIRMWWPRCTSIKGILKLIFQSEGIWLLKAAHNRTIIKISWNEYMLLILLKNGLLIVQCGGTIRLPCKDVLVECSLTLHFY